MAKIDLEKIRKDMLTKQATRVPYLKTSSLAQLDRLSNNIVPEGVTAGRPTASKVPKKVSIKPTPKTPTSDPWSPYQFTDKEKEDRKPSPSSPYGPGSGIKMGGKDTDSFFAGDFDDDRDWQATLDKIDEEQNEYLNRYAVTASSKLDSETIIEPKIDPEPETGVAPDKAQTTSEFFEQLRLSGRQPMDYEDIPQGVRDLTFAEQVGTYNPFKMDSRPGYNFEKYGLPETIQESWIAQQELLRIRHNTARLKWKEGEYIPGPLDTETGAATEKEFRPGFWYDTARVGDHYGANLTADVWFARLDDSDPRMQTLIADMEAIPSLEARISELSDADIKWRMEDSKVKIKSAYDQQLTELKSNLELQELRASSDYEWQRLQETNRASINELEVRRRADEDMAILQNEFESGLLGAKSDLDIKLQENRQNFEDGQASLDRSLQRQEYNEAERSARVMEDMRQQEMDLQQQQFQLTLFMAMAQNPAMLHFLKNSGALALFGDVMGDGGQALQQLMERMETQPSQGMSNIQQVSRLSSEEQANQMYALSAQTGSRDPVSILRGSAPMAHTNPVDPNTPLRGGAPSLSVSNVGGSTASTPLSIGTRAPNLQPRTAPTRPSNGVRLQGTATTEPTTEAYQRWLSSAEEGSEGEKAMGQMEDIANEYREGRYTPKEGSDALIDIALNSPYSEALWSALVNSMMAMTKQPYGVESRRLMIGPLGEWRHSGRTVGGN